MVAKSSHQTLSNLADLIDPMDLLLTDVAMRGTVLAKRMLECTPEMRIVSGYSGLLEEQFTHARLRAGEVLLP